MGSELFFCQKLFLENSGKSTGSYAEGILMSKNFLRYILISLIFLFLCGCAINNKGVSEPVTKYSPMDFENKDSYHYYLMSQTQQRNQNLDQAAAYLKQAIEHDPDSSYLKIELAKLYIDMGNNSGAVSILEQSLKKVPDDLETLILYGKLKHALKDFDVAAVCYEKALARDPGRKNVYVLLGLIYINKKDPTNALRVYNKLVHEFPGSWKGHFYIAGIYADQKEFGKAEEWFLKSLVLKPDFERSRYALIKVYREKNKREKKKAAIKNREKKIILQYEKIIEKNPGNIRAGMELGIFCHENRMIEKAKQTFEGLGKKGNYSREFLQVFVQYFVETKRYEHALIILKYLSDTVQENSPIDYLTGVVFEKMNKNEKAIFYLKKVEPESEFYTDAALTVAFLYNKAGKLHEAVEYLKDAVTQVPDNIQFIVYLSGLYESAGDIQKSENILKKGLEVDPENAKLLFRLGVIYDKSDRKQDCIELMKAIISADPNHVEALNFLGYTYAELGQNLDYAEELIKRALKYKPYDGYITDSLGWIYYKKGLYEKALRIIKKAFELVSDDPCIIEHLGDVYLKLNNTKKALEFYKQSLGIKKDDREKLEKKIEELTK